ncbi:MAG: hypothetical protein JKY61_00075, partial [Planctomycetes bacterium]|nr:hypothetical protein [Planctomycetota bacterium]
WVAKGFSQKKGIDYSETFAPTAYSTSIRTLLATATARGMHIQQMDVATAFLNAPIDHTIFVEPPSVPDLFFFPDDCVLSLKRGLYGLKQSPRLWNECLHEWLSSEGLQRTESDSCIYHRRCTFGYLWVAVYVDDLLIFADDSSVMADFKAKISSRFKMKDLGDPDLCLGVKIVYDRTARTLTLSQEHYLRNVLESFGMVDCKHVGTPLATGYVDEMPSLSDSYTPPDVPFRALMGSLLYAATMTRPDISTGVSMLCRHMKNFTMAHWTHAKHLLRYIKGTIQYRIKYDGSVPPHLFAYSDASYAADMTTSRSRTGYIIFRSGGPVSWNSKLQATVALASADAEYMAMSATAQETIFIRQLLEELFGDLFTRPTLVLTDNQPALHVANRSATRMRHIRVRYHFIRQCVGDGTVLVRYCQTDLMVADLLTKILGKPKTVQFSNMIFRD